jgi:hypothetical protein
MRSSREEHKVSEVAADLASLLPLYNRILLPRRSVALRRWTWIPACAGMTRRWQTRRPAPMALQCAGFDHRACRGAEPLCVTNPSPKNGGQRGLIPRFREATPAVGCVSAAATARRPNAAA